MHRNKENKTLSSFYDLKHKQNGFKNLIGWFTRIFSQETDSHTLSIATYGRLFCQITFSKCYKVFVNVHSFLYVFITHR